MSKVLLLSGGGAKGAFQAGVLDQLFSQGYRPDAVAGISVGALNAAMIATGRWSRLDELWKTITEKKVLKRRGAFRVGGSFLLHKLGVHKAPMGWFSNEPLRELLSTNIGPRFHCDFYCGTVNIGNGKYIEHKANVGMLPYPYVDAIMASTAIPVVFDPVRMSENFTPPGAVPNEMHVDGGVRHMSPIGQIIRDHNPVEITIITCNAYRKDPGDQIKNPRDIVEMGKSTLDTLLSEIFEKDLRQFEMVNRLVRQAQQEGFNLKRSNGEFYKEYKARLFQPDSSLGSSLDFSSEQAAKNLALGYKAKPIKL